MESRKKLDQFLSVIVILLYAVVITIRWIMLYNPDVPEDAIFAITVIATIIRCLMILVVLYNACGFTSNWILRLVFIVIALFLVVSSVIVWVPEIQNQFNEWNIPIIL